MRQKFGENAKFKILLRWKNWLNVKNGEKNCQIVCFKRFDDFLRTELFGICFVLIISLNVW